MLMINKFLIPLVQTIICLVFSVVYASTNYITRRKLWLSLSNIISNIPWTFIGDFNSIVSTDEYKGSHTPAKVPIKDFFDWTDSNQLIHIPILGNSFTWCNGRRDRKITEKKIDRAICNLDLLDICSSVDCHTLTKIKSDHYPILFTFILNKVSFKSQFKFLKMWTLNKECYKVIEEAWKVQVFGFPMCVLDIKIKLLKIILKDWCKKNFGDIQKKVYNIELGLKDIQNDINVSGYSDNLHDKYIKAQHEVQLSLKMEEEFWREKLD